MYLSVIQGEVFARQWLNSGTELHTVPYEPMMHRWLRIAYDAGTEMMDFQTSPDGSTWDSIGTNTVTGFNFGYGYVEAGIGALEGPIVDAERTAAMDDVFVCDDT